MHKVSFFIFFVLFFLTLLSIFIGYLLSEIFAVSGSLFFGNNLFFKSYENFLVENEFLPFYIKLLPLVLSCFVCLFYLIFIEYRFCYFNLFFVRKVWLRYALFHPRIPDDVVTYLDLYFIKRVFYFGDLLGFMYIRYFYLYETLVLKWFFDVVQNQMIAEFFLKRSFVYYYYYIDKGFLETFGPKGLSRFVQNWSFEVMKLHSFFFDSYYIFVFFLFFFFLFGL